MPISRHRSHSDPLPHPAEGAPWPLRRRFLYFRSPSRYPWRSKKMKKPPHRYRPFPTGISSFSLSRWISYHPPLDECVSVSIVFPSQECIFRMPFNYPHIEDVAVKPDLLLNGVFISNYWKTFFPFIMFNNVLPTLLFLCPVCFGHYSWSIPGLPINEDLLPSYTNTHVYWKSLHTFHPKFPY